MLMPASDAAIISMSVFSAPLTSRTRVDFYFTFTILPTTMQSRLQISAENISRNILVIYVFVDA